MSRSYFEFFCPVKVVSGEMALEHIPFELKAVGANRPLIITDVGVRNAGLLEYIHAALALTEVRIIAIFDEVPQDSSLVATRKAAEMYRQYGCDAIIAVGGGSVIDTSKGVNILVSEGGDDLLPYSGAHNLPRPLKPFFVIPTTSGTGSEVTLAAVISDTEKNVKLPFISYFLMPQATILDPRMTLTLPMHITAMTAMDALTHAIEAWTSLASNQLSNAFAFQAIRKISKNVLKVMDNPQDVDGRLQLAEASTMAGIAFSNAMVGLVHAMGHALGAVCHIPHGICMSLFLPYVLEYNLSTNAERLGELLLPLGGSDVYAATPKKQRPRQAIAHIYQLRDDLHRRCGLPRTLVETGKVTRDQLTNIVEIAINDGAILFNPKEAGRDDIRSILNAAWI